MMTTKKTPAVKKASAPALGAETPPPAGSQALVLSSPATPSDFAAAAQQLQDAAAGWHRSGTDPRKDVHGARQAYRIQHSTWPTVLSVSALVFEDICNDPDVVAYIAGIPQRNVYDRIDSYHALLFLAPYFGVRRVEIDPEEQAASVSSPPVG